MAVSLVIAWGADLKEPLEIRRAANKRQAKQIAEEFEKDYPWSPRISLYEEVDFLATEEGMTDEEKQKALKLLREKFGKFSE